MKTLLIDPPYDDKATRIREDKELTDAPPPGHSLYKLILAHTKTSYLGVIVDASEHTPMITHFLLCRMAGESPLSPNYHPVTIHKYDPDKHDSPNDSLVRKPIQTRYTPEVRFLAKDQMTIILSDMVRKMTL